MLAVRPNYPIVRRTCRYVRLTVDTDEGFSYPNMQQAPTVAAYRTQQSGPAPSSPPLHRHRTPLSNGSHRSPP